MSILISFIRKAHMEELKGFNLAKNKYHENSCAFLNRLAVFLLFSEKWPLHNERLHFGKEGGKYHSVDWR